MEMKLMEKLDNQEYLGQLYELLVMADKEFVPPLSARSSTTQQKLEVSRGDGVQAYFEQMKQQAFVLALDGKRVAGFMSFRFDHQCDYSPEGPNLYASTSVVHPDYRGQGLMKEFYRAMIREYPERAIFTRTWEENKPHLRVLEKLGFVMTARLENHRGNGIHTVYFERKSDK